MPSVHYLDKDVLSRLGVRRPPRTARQIQHIRRDPDYFCFPGEARERRAARGDGDGIPRPGIVLGTASTPKTPRERKKGSPASVFDFDTHVSSSKNDAEEIAVADDTASNATSSHQDRSEQLQLEPEQGGEEVSKLGGFEVGQNVWVRVGDARDAEHPAVIASLWGGGDGSNSARVRWTTSNKVDEVKLEQLVSMFGGGDSPVRGRRKGRETGEDVQDTDDCEMLAGPAEMAKIRPKRSHPGEKDATSEDLPTTSRVLRKRSASPEEKDTPSSAISTVSSNSPVPGVNLQRSGKWCVKISFRGKSCYMGLFDNYEHALLANEVARDTMSTHKGSAEAVIQLAKDAITRALSPKAAEACAECRRSKQKCVVTPPNTECDRCISKTGFVCSFIQGLLLDENNLLCKVSRVCVECRRRKQKCVVKHPNAECESCISKPEATCRFESTPIDFKTDGVHATNSGKWRVAFYFRGKSRTIGTFGTKSQAATANAVARRKLVSEKGSTDHVVKLAREAAAEATGRNSSTGSAPSEEKESPAKANEEGTRKVPLGHLGRQRYGKWSVHISFRGESRYMGIFKTKQQATLAREAAHETLVTGQGPTDEIVESAKVAAKEAVSKHMEEEVVAQVGEKEEEPPSIPNQTEGAAANLTWVECDRCKKWRRLCGIVDESEIPSQWYCSMNNDPNRAQCSAPEEEYGKRPRRMQRPRVYATGSGRWKVELEYNNKNRHIGIYATIEQAAFVNAFVQELAQKTDSFGIAEEVAKENIKLVKTKATEVLSQFIDRADCAQDRCPFRIVGVKDLQSGHWEVGFPYKEAQCDIGPFATQEEAALANAVARGHLAAKEQTDMPNVEIEQSIDLAKEAASNALPLLFRKSQEVGHSTRQKTKATRKDVVIANQHSPSTRPCHQCGFLLPHNQTHCAKCLTAADAAESTDKAILQHITSAFQSELNGSNELLLASSHSSFVETDSRQAEAQTPIDDEDSEEEEWLCDVCQTARFATLDEAAAHERTCCGVPSPELADELRTHVATDELPLQETDLVVEAAATETSLPAQADGDEPANTAFWDPLASHVNEALDQNNAVALSAANAPKEIWHEPVAETPTPLPRPGGTRPCDQCGFLMLHNQTDCAACRRPPKRQSAEDGLLHSKRKNDDTVARAQQPLAFAHAIARSRQLYNLQRMATVPNPRSLGQTLISKDSPWFYVDTQDSVQGPFPGDQMRRWLDGGHFNDRLRISQHRGGPYSTLSSYFPDRDVAFTGLVPREEAVESEEEKLLSRRRKGARQEAAERRGEEEARWMKNALETRRNVDDKEIARRRNAERVRSEAEEAQLKADEEAAKARQERRIADAEEYQKAKRKDREEAEQAPQLSRQPGGHASAEMTLEDTSLGAELRRCALETCLDGPKLLLDEQPLEKFEAWLSNRKAKWGRGQTGGKPTQSADSKKTQEEEEEEVVAQVGEEEEEPPSISNQTEGASSATWVECDRCKKWRRLHGVVDASDLPSQWYCSMNNDPGRADCSAPEEAPEDEYDIPAPLVGEIIAPKGVYATKSGKWKVEVKYNDKSCNVGTYATIEQATLVSAFARELTKTARDLVLAEEEAKENIQLLKAKAAEVLSQFIDRADCAQDRCPFRTAGVKELDYGRWEVAFSYRGSQCIVGSFATQEEAALANAVARGYLVARDEQALTDSEIKQSIDFAKEAASNALSTRYRCRKADLSHSTDPMVDKLPSLGTAEPKKETSVNYWTSGVRELSSGNWEVRIGYRGKRRCIGTFATRDNAAAANEVARKLLDQTIVSKLSEEEAKENVLSAKEAAKQAVDVAQTSSRPNIDIWAHEGDCDGPRLRRGRLQDEKKFTPWHADRKSKWKSKWRLRRQHRSPNSCSVEPQKAVPFPESTVSYLKDWISRHEDNPYPDPAQKDKMIADTGLTRRQLSDWMGRARRKLKRKAEPPSMKRKPEPPSMPGLDPNQQASTVSSRRLCDQCGFVLLRNQAHCALCPATAPSADNTGPRDSAREETSEVYSEVDDSSVLSQTTDPDEMGQYELESEDDSEEEEITTGTRLEIEIHSCIMEAGRLGSNLLPGRSQPKEEFDAWLADKKKSWRRE